MLTPITEIFYQVDEFCKHFGENKGRFLLPCNSGKKRMKKIRMSLSEIMTILILFHFSDYRTFKHFYINCIRGEMQSYFPASLSYSRFVQLTEIALLPLMIFFQGIKGKATDVYYVDSTSIEACHIKREKRHKVFKGLATKGKNSMGWFFGFKLHIVINKVGEIMSFQLTPAHINDRAPVPFLVRKLQGWLFGDKGYLGREFAEKLKENSIRLFTKVKKNMKDIVLTPAQNFYLKKRGIVETVIDQLKNLCQVEHSRHRKPINALVNIISALVAYSLKIRKPTVKNFNHQKLNTNLI